MHLLEKYLPHDGNYRGAQYDIIWHNFTSGPPLNSELLADKLDIGKMADFPAVLGASAFQKANNGVRTYYIATSVCWEMLSSIFVRKIGNMFMPWLSQGEAKV
jgi:NitT/TauT family transport system substrate-binding protein